MHSEGEKMTTPSQDGYHMPGEFEPHRGCVMIWPVRPGSWPHGAKAAQAAFTRIARTIAESEQVFMCAYGTGLVQAREVFAKDECVQVLELETEDAWARDIGPTFVVNGKGMVRGVDWRFNAWGGAEGLCDSWDKDVTVADSVVKLLGASAKSCELTLEGGNLTSNGHGTVVAVKAAIVNKNRNPDMT